MNAIGLGAGVGVGARGRSGPGRSRSGLLAEDVRRRLGEEVGLSGVSRRLLIGAAAVQVAQGVAAGDVAR